MLHRTALRARLLAVSVTGGLLLLTAGCGTKEFEDHTAVLHLGDRTVNFTIDGCGLDGEVVRIVGRADDGTVLQAVVQVEADDHETGVPASSGLTVMAGGSTWGAFGKESWQRRGKSGPAPGTVSSAGVRGARIGLAGEAVPLDEQDDPIADGTPSRFDLDARCDDPEQ